MLRVKVHPFECEGEGGQQDLVMTVGVVITLTIYWTEVRAFRHLKKELLIIIHHEPLDY